MSRFFFYPRTHRSLRERLPPPPARFASDSLLASRAKTPARFASDSLLASRAKNRLTSLNCLQIYSNCLRFFRDDDAATTLSTCGLVPSNCVFVTGLLVLFSWSRESNEGVKISPARTASLVCAIMTSSDRGSETELSSELSS